jgi:hypothetical protein
MNIGASMSIHDWENAPETEWRRFVADHMERMAENQMVLSGAMKEFLENCNNTRDKGGKDIIDMKSNLKWLWISGGLVVTGIGIAIGEIWRRVF